MILLNFLLLPIFSAMLGSVSNDRALYDLHVLVLSPATGDNVRMFHVVFLRCFSYCKILMDVVQNVLNSEDYLISIIILVNELFEGSYNAKQNVMLGT